MKRSFPGKKMISCWVQKLKLSRRKRTLKTLLSSRITVAIEEKDGERTQVSSSAIEGSKKLPGMSEGIAQFFDEVLGFDSDC